MSILPNIGLKKFQLPRGDITNEGTTPDEQMASRMRQTDKNLPGAKVQLGGEDEALAIHPGKPTMRQVAPNDQETISPMTWAYRKLFAPNSSGKKN